MATRTAVIAPDAGPARTRGLLKGNPNLNARRRPPVHQRVGTAAAAVLGAEVGELVHAVLQGVKAGSVPAQVGRLVLERALPPGRPVRLELPYIHGPEHVMRALDMIAEALDGGRITLDEARGLQDYVLGSWRARREAQQAWEKDEDDVPEEEKRRVICEMAGRYGMVWPKGAGPATTMARAERRRA
jgi:hypothetical protein